MKAQALVGAGDMAVKNSRLLAAIPFYENARMNQSEHLEPAEVAWLVFRLALLLPLQGRVEEAQTLLGSLQPVIAGDPRLDTAITWLSWRNGSSYQTASQGFSTETSATPVTPGASLLNALVADFHGQWQQAIKVYEESQMNEAAALASVRLGDSLMQQGYLDEAGEAYKQALAIWSGLPANASGMALVAYRQAEWFFKKQNQVESRLLLNQSMVWLAQAPASIRSEGRNLVKQAFKILEKNKSITWPAWRWFAIDDTQRIQILFPTEAIVHNV
jgi:tetratricopeptide (TPR) repeat protein